MRGYAIKLAAGAALTSLAAMFTCTAALAQSSSDVVGTWTLVSSRGLVNFLTSAECRSRWRRSGDFTAKDTSASRRSSGPWLMAAVGRLESSYCDFYRRRNSLDLRAKTESSNRIAIAKIPIWRKISSPCEVCAITIQARINIAAAPRTQKTPPQKLSIRWLGRIAIASRASEPKRRSSAIPGPQIAPRKNPSPRKSAKPPMASITGG